MLSNNYAFDVKRPSLQLKLYDWANGKERALHWHNLLAMTAFSIVAGLIWYFLLALFVDEFYLIANNIIALLLLLILSLVFGINFLLAAKSLCNSYFWQYATTKGINDNSKSIKYTLEVIKQARRWLVLYDYGEAQPGNIYSSTEVRAALLAKLDEADDGFKLSMIFKKDQQEVDKLPLVQALKQWQGRDQEASEQVEILCGKDRAAKQYAVYNQECNGFPNHYKINDAGYAYLTSHAESVARRKFIFYQPAAGWHSVRVSDCLAFHNSVIANG